MIAALLVAVGGVAFAKKDKVDIKPSVTYAKSWDLAVEEAKTLNVPIVVHSHGFY
jgi:hypothetical protein